MGGAQDASVNQAKPLGGTTTLGALAACGVDRGTLLGWHRLMVLARTLDDAEVKLRRQQRTFFEIGCAGHEAVQAVATSLLRPGYDWFYPYYRDRVLCLGLGVTPTDMLLQAMGKRDDPSSGGREMPAHYGSRKLGIVNQSSPTGTQYLQAAGTAEAGLLVRASAAMSQSTRGGNGSASLEDIITSHHEDEIVYVSGGEGSTSEGEFFEALCLASLRKLPVLFLIQDNAYAISVPVEVQTPGAGISTIVRGFPHLHVAEINGLDIVESYMGLREAVLHARTGRGPALVHARVVRLCPHSDSDDDRAYKTQAEKAWEHERDPFRTFEDLLVREGTIGSAELEAVRVAVRAEVARAVDQATAAPNPSASSVSLHLFSPRAAVTAETRPSEGGPPITMVDAINKTLESEMRRDPRIVCFGEDVADLSRSRHLETLTGKGGVFKATHGLQRKFGDHRVFNTPIAEAGIIGRAIGLAIRGFRPVPEIQFFDYIWPAMQQIRNELGMLRWRSNGEFTAPVVIRVATGGYLTGGGPYHSQSGESIFCHCPGLRVVMPSNARDAAGLLRTALRSDDPVLFFEHKHLYRRGHARSPNPGPDHVVPLGVAATVREGTDATIVTYGALVEKSLRAAEVLDAEGIDVEVIDLRSLQPLDWDSIARSVVKTSRVVVASEETRAHGFAAEVAARIAEELFAALDAPIGRVGALDVPVAYAPVLEKATLPQVDDIVRALRQVCAF